MNVQVVVVVEVCKAVRRIEEIVEEHLLQLRRGGRRYHFAPRSHYLEIAAISSDTIAKACSLASQSSMQLELL